VKPALAGGATLGRGVAERLASASPMSLFARDRQWAVQSAGAGKQ